MHFGKSGHCILERTNERGGLYLSNLDYAKDKEILVQNNIKHVMTVGAKLQINVDSNNIKSHIKYSIYDTEQDDIKQFFKQATLFLRETIFEKKENVLIHCHQGASRSASIAIAFFMKCLKWTYDRSFSYLRRIRNQVNPNKGFVNQLKSYERELGLASKPAAGTVQKKGKKSTELQRHYVENLKSGGLIEDNTLIEDSATGAISVAA